MSKHFVINIGRQFGSGGKTIGERIARRLGIRLYDKELISLAAEESGFSIEHFERADEQERKGGLSSLVGFFRTPLSGNYYATSDPLSNDSLFKIQSDVIRRIAERESCIFVGRCADYILRDHPLSVNLFLTADTEDRINRITVRTGCSEEEARRLIERFDTQRARYYNYYSAHRWGEAATYDLTLNTSRLGEEGSTELILNFAAHKLDIDL